MNLIADIGSCWGSTEDDAKKCIDLLADTFKYIKLQLCSASGGNKPYSFPLKPLVQYGESLGVKVSASVWGEAGYYHCLNAGATWIKYAHSAYNEDCFDAACSDFATVIATKPIMKPFPLEAEPNLHLLWTYEVNNTPVYPVLSELHHSNMYEDYDGFSCHALGIHEVIKARDSGAKWCEVHVNPLYVQGVPDAIFALKMDQIKQLGGYKNDISDRVTRGNGEKVLSMPKVPRSKSNGDRPRGQVADK